MSTQVVDRNLKHRFIAHTEAELLHVSRITGIPMRRLLKPCFVYRDNDKFGDLVQLVVVG